MSEIRHIQMIKIFYQQLGITINKKKPLHPNKGCVLYTVCILIVILQMDLSYFNVHPVIIIGS